MNTNEKKMVELLKKGKEKYGYLAVKAEFEAEGTRIDELLRLMDIASTAQVKVTVKIGGCEAIRDLLEAKQLGVDYIVAPMVETPYALSKFAMARDKVFSVDEQLDVDFLFNMETVTAYNLRNEIIKEAKKQNLAGVVFGRSDFSGSMDKTPEHIESEDLTEKIVEVSEMTKENALDLVVGGAVSSGSVENLKKIHQSHLTRFETRKIIFSSSAITLKGIDDGLKDAVQFELLWLKNKRDYYAAISKEDEKRFTTLANRWGFKE